MKSTGAVRPRLRASRTMESMLGMRTPFWRAMALDFWIVGPSVRGSVKGIPSSMMSRRIQMLD